MKKTTTKFLKKKQLHFKIISLIKKNIRIYLGNLVIDFCHQVFSLSLNLMLENKKSKCNKKEKKRKCIPSNQIYNYI